MSRQQQIVVRIAEPFPIDLGLDRENLRPEEVAAKGMHCYPAGSEWREPYHPATYRLRRVRADALRAKGWTVTVEVEDAK